MSLLELTDKRTWRRNVDSKPKSDLHASGVVRLRGYIKNERPPSVDYMFAAGSVFVSTTRFILLP